MSIIALTSNGLNGDFEIAFADENFGVGTAVQGVRMIRRASGATSTVHLTQALYSAAADKSDEFRAMGFTNPMIPTTPNAFVLPNGYFMPRSSMEFLRQGAISADWSAGDANEIRSILHNDSTPFVVGDIGREVLGGTTGDTGTLLDFETLPDGTTIIWIRPETTADTFQNASEVLEVTTDGGTGTVTSTAVSTSGDQVYAAIQVIGGVQQATDVYLYQDRFKMTDSTGAFQWWDTNAALSLGIIDILIRTKRDAVGITDGDVEVFARQYTTLYDHFRLNIAAGGFQALPLASNPDTNNTTGYRVFTGSAGVNTFDVGNGIYVGATYATATKRGVLTAVTGSVAAPVLEYYLVGDLTDFVASDAVKEFIFATELDGDATCTAGAPAFNPGGPTDPGAGEGGSVTYTIGHTVVDHDGNGTAEPYSITVDTQGDVPAAKVYERNKHATRRGATAADLFGAGVNVPGESYRGLEVLAFYDAPAGVFTEGDDVTGQGGYTSRVISNNTAGAGEGALQAYVMMTDQQTSLDAAANNDVLTDESSDTVTVDTAGAGGAVQVFASSKQSPLGTFTGTEIFGERGVVYINPASGEAKLYKLKDDLNAARNPPNLVSATFNNTAAGDRVFLARDTGAAGIVDKDLFGGIEAPAGAFNGIGDVIVRVAGSVDTEVPAAAVVRLIETTLREEHRYRYASRTLGALGEFSLTVPTSDTGTVTTASTTQVIDLGQLFSSGATPVEVGDLVRNTFAGKTLHVWEVTNVVSDTVLDVTAIYGPLDATQDWDVGDTYEINKLIQTYATSDDLHDLLLDEEATGGSVTNTYVQSTSQGVVGQVRQGKVILPFDQNATADATGVSITTVRTPDTIAT